MTDPIRIVYSDLDGTMLGAYGCFFLDEEAAPTSVPARALHDLHARGVPLVLVSGRTRTQLGEATRLLGADGYVAELGAVIGWERGFCSEMVPGLLPPEYVGRLPADVIEELGVVEALMDAFPGRVEWHSPWHTGREADAMIRGRLDLPDVRRWLTAQGLRWLDLVDNGVLPVAEPPPGVTTGLDRDAWPPRVYHLLPAHVTKGTGVAADLERRGLSPSDAIAIGDSVSDLEMAPHVREMWVVANGQEDAEVAALLPGIPNVRRARRSLGQGWADAIDSVLT